MSVLPAGGTAAALTRWTVRAPRVVVTLLVLVTLGLGAGTTRLRTDVGYRAFLGAAHPALTELDRFLERFGGGLPLVAVWSCDESTACDSAFDSAALAMAHDVAARLDGLPGVRRVDSPATSAVLMPEILGLPRGRRLAPEGTPVGDVGALIARARQDPLWVGQLVSDDATAGAVIVHLTSADGPSGGHVLRALRSALAPHEARGFRFHLVGGPVEFVVAGGELDRAAARIVPLMVALIAIVLLWLLGSVAAAAVALVTVGIAILWTLGAMGWLGWPRNSLAQALPPLLLVVGVADTIHLLARLLADGEHGPAPSVVDAAAAIGPPCLMTSLTTAVGFLSLAVSPLASIAQFGVLAAFGVTAAFVLTFTALPLLLQVVPRRRLDAPRALARSRRALARLAGIGERRSGGILVAAGAVAVVAGLGCGALRIDASFEDLYGAESQVVRWARAVSAVLRPPDTLELALTPPAAGDGELARGLVAVERLATRLSGLDGLGRVRSILDPIRQLNALVHRDALTLEPDDGRAASLLRLLRREEPALADLFVDRGSGALRVTVEAEKLPQARLRAVMAEVRALVAAHRPAGWTVTITGPLAVVHVMIDDLRATQLRSFAAATVLVLGAVALFFRSLRYAALAAIPTLFPVLLTLGVMGLAGIPLDVGSAMVAAVILGIAVDNAIHLLTAYRRRRATGAPPAAASAGAVADTGHPLTTSAIALAAGFFALALSPWTTIASFGVVTGVAIGAALLAALVILPAVLCRGAV